MTSFLVAIHGPHRLSCTTSTQWASLNTRPQRQQHPRHMPYARPSLVPCGGCSPRRSLRARDSPQQVHQLESRASRRMLKGSARLPKPDCCIQSCCSVLLTSLADRSSTCKQPQLGQHRAHSLLQGYNAMLQRNFSVAVLSLPAQHKCRNLLLEARTCTCSRLWEGSIMRP